MDSKIIDLFISRDEKAIIKCSERYGAALRNISYNILNDLETVKECENDTYMQAWNLIPPNEPRSYLFAFLARIIRHLSIDCCRKNHAEKRSGVLVELTTELECCIPDGTYGDVQDEITGKELGELLNRFLGSLSAENRKMFVRRYWYMDSMEKIANMNSCSVSKVKTRLFRMRKDLQKYLEKEGYRV